MKAFEPLVIRNMNLKNRVVMPPMCMYSAFNKDGRVGDFHLAHHVARGVPGHGRQTHAAVVVDVCVHPVEASYDSVFMTPSGVGRVF